MQVTFLNPGDKSDPFFDTLVSFMRRAASDLGVELEVVDGHRDHAKLRANARAAVERATPPEYLLLVNEQGLAVEVLPAASARGSKVLLLNEGLMVPDRQALGHPGERHPGWLGELVPDDRRAGQILAETLFEAARAGRGGRGGKLGVAALGGSFTSSSLLRINGLRQAVNAAPDVVLHEVVAANWQQDRAKSETARLLAAHPDLAVVWAASDQMALGAAEAIAAAGRVPGRDVLLGGIDWAPFAFDEVRRGTFNATVGGHFLDGAWAIVLLYDHHRRPQPGAIAEKSQLAVVTKSNVDDYERLFSRRQQVDFRQFSKVHNPAQAAYRFGVDSLL
ncbi:MAG TPA: ABC transporter substrate-binding protein [Thermoanaerobaculia bacterium]|nr:ABC transporter substrate-binding protein [Thermoanaerobaculia bacterium]